MLLKGDEIDKGVLECVLNSVKEIEKLGVRCFFVYVYGLIYTNF